MFDLLVKIVSFDFFPIHQYVDFSFTKTEPWSTSFAWLDYDSVNFVESMGSASIIFALLTLLAVVTLVFWIIENKCEVKFWFRSQAEPQKFQQKSDHESCDSEQISSLEPDFSGRPNFKYSNESMDKEDINSNRIGIPEESKQPEVDAGFDAEFREGGEVS